jgi:hypothetical protein
MGTGGEAVFPKPVTKGAVMGNWVRFHLGNNVMKRTIELALWNRRPIG